MTPSLARKRVSFAPVPEPLQPCCDLSRGRGILALCCVRATQNGVEFGYALHSEHCDCDDRWIAHDWRKGHLQFVRRDPTAYHCCRTQQCRGGSAHDKDYSYYVRPADL